MTNRLRIPSDAVLPQGSLILITGVTGFLAGLIADQLLLHGFRVRGTVRDLVSDKASWMPDFFEEKYERGSFEMVLVENMSVENCFHDAVRGCDAIVHVASVVAFVADPREIVTPSMAFLSNLLAAAKKEKSIKRFVLTSSSAAVSQNVLNTAYDLTDRMWAQWAIEKAWAPPPYTMQRALANYYAAKAQTEQSLWQYVNDEKPHFVANSVLPDFIIGLSLNLDKQGHTSSMGVFKEMFEGGGATWKLFGPQWCVDGTDTAILHMAGLLHPHTENERIFAYAHRKTWTDFIRRLRVMYPEHQFPDPDPDEGEDLSNVVDCEKAESLLRWMGRSGWRPLDQMLKEVGDTLV